MSKNVLIAGGSGNIGFKLTEILLKKGYKVTWLSSSRKSYPGVNSFQWDYTKNHIDEKALDGTDHIINLAGAGIGEKKWTRERKKLLRESRIKTAELLLKTLHGKSTLPKAYISASAIGYYGYDSGSIEKKEGSRFGDDFLATLTKDWEAEADNFSKMGIRTVKLRTGIVVGKNQVAWEKIARVIKTGFGAAVGSGDQYMSWIHIDDLCKIYLWAIEHEHCEGVFNAVAPHPVTNKEFMRAAVKALKKPLFMPNVPGFVLRLLYGEIASVLIGSSRVSSEKIQQEGFQFDFPELELALKSV